MAAFNRRYYDGGGSTTTLASSMSSTDTSFTLSSASGWPGSPGNDFVVVIDRGLSSEEKILCSSNSGTTVTVASSGRGYDDTSATTHSQNATVSLCGAAIDFDESNQITNLLGNGAEGSLFYGKGSGALPAKLAIATTAGEVLASNGTDPIWQQPFPSTTVSSNTNLSLNNAYLVSANSPTLTLPAPVKGGWIKVTNYGSGAPTVTHNASEVIFADGYGSAGSDTLTMGSYGATATLESDGTNWYTTAGAWPQPQIVLSNGAYSATSGTGHTLAHTDFTINSSVGTWTTGTNGFEVPSPGTYLFALNVGLPLTGILQVALVKNGTALAHPQFYSNSATVQSGGLTVALVAAAGDFFTLFLEQFIGSTQNVTVDMQIVRLSD